MLGHAIQFPFFSENITPNKPGDPLPPASIYALQYLYAVDGHKFAPPPEGSERNGFEDGDVVVSRRTPPPAPRSQCWRRKISNSVVQLFCPFGRGVGFRRFQLNIDIGGPGGPAPSPKCTNDFLDAVVQNMFHPRYVTPVLAAWKVPFCQR